MPYIMELFDISILKDICTSIFLILLISYIKNKAIQYINQKGWESESKVLRVRTYARNIYISLILISVVVVWIPKMQYFVFAFSTISAGIMIVFKEIILNISGSVYRKSADLFSIEDSIQINGVEGKVIHNGFLTTDILEVGKDGEHTGKVSYIPNSWFFQYSLHNSSEVPTYVYHVLKIPIDPQCFSQSLMHSLLDYTKEVVKEYMHHHSATCDTKKTKVLLNPYDIKAYQLIIQMYVPVQDTNEISQKIYLQYVQLINPTNLTRSDDGKNVPPK